jgi:antitoxin component YwqK of YwqJK toxin-antitoxin module
VPAESFSILGPDGERQMAGAIADGRLQGVLKIFERGAPQAAIAFSDGVQEGECIILYAPHRPMARTNYAAGRLHGPAEYYAQDGTLVRKTHYRQGALHGVQQDYYPDGTLFEESHYRDGLLDGSWQRFHPNGVLSERRRYAGGLLERVAELFNDQGKAVPGPVAR